MGSGSTLETTETNFEKVLDDLLNKAYDLDHLLGTLEKLAETTKNLKETNERAQEELKQERANRATPPVSNPAED